MSKYKSKTQLLTECIKEKEILDKLINSIGIEDQTKSGVCGEWSIKDVICHLSEWQRMVIDWYAKGNLGETPEVPGYGYKWSELPQLNNFIYEKYKNFTWDEAMEAFSKTDTEIMKIINNTSEEIMLKPGLQTWMNKNSLIAYFGSCTSSHYKWASCLIKKYLKSKK